MFAYPVAAGWDTTEEAEITTATVNATSGSDMLLLDTYNGDVVLGLMIDGTNIASGATVVSITSSNIKTLGAITGGSGYVDGSYTDVPLTGGNGAGAEADITVSGGAVTAVTIASVGAGYEVNDVLSASNTNLGGTGSGFSVPVSDIYQQAIEMSSAATGTGSVIATFSTEPGLIKVYQHEFGTNAIDGTNVTAIESYFETNDLGWVSGGPSEIAMVGANKWLRLERVEPDFLQEGDMSLIVTGRPYAQSEDVDSNPYTFAPNTNKIDMKEQRRELRLRFVSNVADGDYQVGRVILSADIGDVRGY